MEAVKPNNASMRAATWMQTILFRTMVVHQQGRIYKVGNMKYNFQDMRLKLVVFKGKTELQRSPCNFIVN